MNEKEKFLEIISLTEEIKDDHELEQKIIAYHPYDIAKAFEKGDDALRKRLHKVLKAEELADIYEYLEDEDAVKYFSEIDKNKAAAILNEMTPDDATDVINELDEDDKASEYLSLLDKDAKEEISRLSEYEDDTAGSVMTTNYIEVSSGLDVKEAMKTLVSMASESEIIDPIYVTNQGILVGTLSLKDLLIARSPKIIDDIMDDNLITVDVEDELKEVSDKISNYDLYSIAVLENKKMVGIITMDDAIDIVSKEATEDYEKLAGMSSSIEDSSIFKTLLKRTPWLLLLLFLSMFMSSIIDGFEGIIKQVTVLVFFQSIILDTAGNSGTQSLAVTIRGLSKDDLNTNKKILMQFFKEIKVGIINGVLLGILAFGVSYIFLLISKTEFEIWRISLVVSIAMMASLFASSFIGTLIPVLLYKIKLDPAVASGPFITTINDITSLLIYFSIASALLANYL